MSDSLTRPYRPLLPRTHQRLPDCLSSERCKRGHHVCSSKGREQRRVFVEYLISIDLQMRTLIVVSLAALLSWRASGAYLKDRKAFRAVVASSLDDGGGGGVQVMITRRMRKVLVDELGYLSSEVDAMEPSVAAVVLERGLARPSNGMPASWRRTADPVNPFKSKNPAVRLVNAALNLTRGLARGLIAAVGVASSKTLSVAALLVVVPFCYNVVTSDGGITIENIDKAAQSTKEVLGAGAVGVEKGVRKGKAFVKTKINDNKSPQIKKKSKMSFPSSSKGDKARVGTGGGSKRRVSTSKAAAAARGAKADRDNSKSRADPPVPFAGHAKSMTADNSHKGGSDRLDIESYESVMDSTSPVETARVNIGKLKNSFFSGSK